MNELKDWNVSELSPLALAYVGDAVWEVYARNHVLRQGIRRPKELHRAATKYVSAIAQARLAAELWDSLTDEEQAVLRRGRNAKSGHVRKNADVLDYRHSTGFEAVIGYLYGSGNKERLEQLCRLALERADEWKKEQQ
ncbi:ribonuclease III [Alicyclobacillus curvatus]|nr:ribonuclease III [Alicyclobacillus curvatus]